MDVEDVTQIDSSPIPEFSLMPIIDFKAVPVASDITLPRGSEGAAISSCCAFARSIQHVVGKVGSRCGGKCLRSCDFRSHKEHLFPMFFPFLSYVPILL